MRVSMSRPVISACSGLMYTGVPTRTPSSVKTAVVGQAVPGRLGDAEVDDLRHRLAVVDRDEDVRRLEVAVNDAFLVGVLHRLADLR